MSKKKKERKASIEKNIDKDGWLFGCLGFMAYQPL